MHTAALDRALIYIVFLVGGNWLLTTVNTLKQAGVTRVLNHYRFSGYMIFAGLPPFIDGRTELYGEAFVLQHAAAQMLKRPVGLFTLLDDVDGWRKLFIHDCVVVHIGDPEAIHSVDPEVKSSED